MSIAAHFELTGRRGAARRVLHLNTTGTGPSGESNPVTVHNASTTGLLLETAEDLERGDTLLVDLPEIGEVEAEVVWAGGDLYGCRFAEPIGDAVLSAAELRSATGPISAATASAAGPSGAFGPRLQRLRKERGLTLAQIADAIGVSKPTVWAWEHGKARPIAERLGKLAEALDVTDEELLAGDSLADREALLTRCRDEIAMAYGTSPQKIRVMIEL